MRHSDAGLAIPDFPTSYGHLLPPTQIDAAFRQEAIHRYGLIWGSIASRCFKSGFISPIGSGRCCCQRGRDRAGAVILAAAAACSRRLPGRRGRCCALLLIQVTLGILTVLLRKPADIASAHVAVGALLLVTIWVIAMRAHRRRQLGPSRI